MISNSLIKTSNSSIQNNLNNIATNRELNIQVNKDSRQKQLNMQKEIKTIKGFLHILKVYPYYKDLSVTMVKGIDNFSGSGFILKSEPKQLLPSITNGKTFNELDKNVAIIPSKIRVGSSLHGNYKKIENTYIGKELTFRFVSEKSDKFFLYKCKIVGIYNSDDIPDTGNVVFVPINDLFKNLSLQYQKKRGQLFQSKDELLITAFIDDYKNVKSVISKLSNINGYTVNYIKDNRVEISSFKLILLISRIINVMIILVIFVICMVVIEKVINNKVYDIALFKAIGYRDLHIFLMIFLEIFIIVIIAYCISVLISVFAVRELIYPILKIGTGDSLIKINISKYEIELAIPSFTVITVFFLVCIRIPLKIMNIYPKSQIIDN